MQATHSRKKHLMMFYDTVIMHYKKRCQHGLKHPPLLVDQKYLDARVGACWTRRLIPEPLRSDGSTQCRTWAFI